MTYMLDTTICIYIIRRNPIRVLQRLQTKSITDVSISSITVSEMEYGVEKSQRKTSNRIALLRFLAPLSVLSYDANAARHYGNIRTTLEKTGQPIGAMDLLIAAHARALNLILVTNNVNEFSRIPGLQIENWT